MQIFYLLSLVDDRQRGHITVLVSPEHLAHGACRCLTGETVDVDLLLLMLVTHQLLLLCFGQEWPVESKQRDLWYGVKVTDLQN